MIIIMIIIRIIIIIMIIMIIIIMIIIIRGELEQLEEDGTFRVWWLSALFVIAMSALFVVFIALFIPMFDIALFIPIVDNVLLFQCLSLCYEVAVGEEQR